MQRLEVVSVSALPLLQLCPMVSRPPVLEEKCRKSSPSPSQQALAKLLKQRHARFLAANAAPPAMAHVSAQLQAHATAETSASTTSLLCDLDCSKLAEDVVYRAKVRLSALHPGAGAAERTMMSRRRRARLSRVKWKNHSEHSVQVSAGDCEFPHLVSPAVENDRFTQDCKNTSHNKLKSRSHRVSSRPRKQLQKSNDDGIDLVALCYTIQPSPSRACESHKLNSPSARNLSQSTGDLAVVKPCKHIVAPFGLKQRSNSDIHDQMNAANSTKRQRVRYLSQQQSLTPTSTGIPNAPPTSPSQASTETKNIPCFQDIKSQRMLKNRLEEINAKVREKAANALQVARKEEKRKEREATLRLKAQQRIEIYALNKVMTNFEEQCFKAFSAAKI